MRDYLAIALLLLVAGCATGRRGHQLGKDERLLVGGWICTQFTFTQHYAVRHSDGTFTEYRFNQVEGNGKAATFVLKGTWRLKGRYYELKYEDSSGAGKPHLLEIYKHTPDLFEYTSNDGCPISERKATDKELQDLAVNPFQFITEQAKAEYTIESR